MLAVGESPSIENQSSIGSLANFIAAVLPTRRIPSRNTFVIGQCLPSLQTYIREVYKNVKKYLP